MAEHARVVMKDPVLRARLSAIPEQSWYNACEMYWEISPEKMTAKSLRDDVRQRLRWVKTPNRQTVGLLPRMLFDFVKVAADHLKRDGVLSESGIPDNPENWKALLDGVAVHLGADYADFCRLASPPDLNWTFPELSVEENLMNRGEESVEESSLRHAPDAAAAANLTNIVDHTATEPMNAHTGTRATSSELTGILDELRLAGSAVLVALETVRDCIDDTRVIDDDLQDLVDTWNDALMLFARGMHGHDECTRGGLDTLAAEVDRVRVEEESQAEQRELLEEQTCKLVKFEEKRGEDLYEEDEDYRAFVDRRVAGLVREIADLEAAIGTSIVESGTTSYSDGLVETELDLCSVESDEGQHPAVPEAPPEAMVSVAYSDSIEWADAEADPATESPNDLASTTLSADSVEIDDPFEAVDTSVADTSVVSEIVGDDREGLVEVADDAVILDGATSSEIDQDTVVKVDNFVREQKPVPAPAAPSTPAPSATPYPSVIETAQGNVQRDTAVERDLATLIGRNMWSAVSAVAPATDLDIGTIRALDFCAETFSLSIVSTDPYEMLGRNTASIGEALQSPSTDAALLTVVGVLRTCLQFGREHCWLLTDESFDALPGNWREAGRTLRDAVADGYQHGWENTTAHNAIVPPALLKREAEDLRDTLPKRSNKFQRAGSVLRHMMSSGGDLDSALDLVVAWADGDGDLDSMRTHRDLLGDPRRLIDRNDAALYGTKQKKAPIVAKAYENLVSRIREVKQLLDRAIVVAESEAKHVPVVGPRADRVREIVQNLPQVGLDGGLGAAALDRFRVWLVSGDGPTSDAGRTYGQLKFIASLPAVSAVRDEQSNLPVRSSVEGRALTQELLEPRSEHDLFHAYLHQGNLVAAGTTRDDSDSMLALRTAQRDWRNKIEVRIVDLQSDLLRMQAQTQVDPIDRARLDGRISALSTVVDNRFDVAAARALEITDELASIWKRGRAELLDSMRELDLAIGINADDAERIEARIDQNDFITAREFMSILSNDRGRSLPPAEDSGLVALLRFRDLLDSWQGGSTNVLEIVQEHLGSPLPESTATALKAWNQGRKARRFSEWQRLLPSILGLLGLDKAPQIPVVDKTDRSQNRLGKFVVKATPNGESYVAALGSRTRRKGYIVYILPPDKLIESAFDLIPTGERREAILMFYPGILSWDDRKKIRIAAEKKKVTALVIDTAALAYMALERESKFTSLQRVTLPFSIFPHWAPRVAGDVPDELFVGRVEEIDKIISREGSIFVYGGRQLGKSALLHRIERDFNKMDKKLAIYIDFKVERIGEENEPEHLWTVLRNRLQDEEIIPSNNNSTKSEAIVKAIRDWLDADADRGILLLCDETDAFLQNEARERMANNRPVSFPNVAALKGLMDKTHRRFKPVFAGLHQVQRIADTPNSPLAHGGEDILVGPLNAQEAWDLVVRPFKALGYQFESLDLVWRLLAFTNHHAGLVQIVCDELYKDLRSRRITTSEPPYIIRTADVDHVITSKGIRDFIAERFRLTIQLEDRYFVIAMGIALLGLDKGFENRYALGEILEHCRSYWSGGFETLSEDELSVYLEEMVGLGVLVRGSDKHYGMRSPNVVHMLGDRETIENQLLAGRFELPLQYNARVSRRRLSAARGIEKYSPLTEHELSRVMPKRMGTGRDRYAFAVIGSAALGIGSVRDVLVAASKEDYEYGLEMVPAEESKELVRAGAGAYARRPLVVCDATDDPRYLLEVVDRIGSAAKGAKVGRRGILLGAFGASIRRDLTAMGVEVVPLQLWTVETVRATIDNPITDPAQREEFVKASGGWPSMCERYLDDIRTGTAVADVINRAAEFPADLEEATRLLTDVGLTDARDLALLVSWAEIAEDGDVIDRHTLAELLDIDADDLSTVIDRLSVLSIVTDHTDGIVLNDVVRRSLKAVGATDAQ